MDWITRIMIWVVLVTTFVMAFNGWITTKQFTSFQEISLAQLAAFEKYHAEEIESHAALDKEIKTLTEAVNNLYKCLEKKKVATVTK